MPAETSMGNHSRSSSARQASSTSSGGTPSITIVPFARTLAGPAHTPAVTGYERGVTGGNGVRARR